MLGSKLLVTWHLLYLISSQNALADLVEVLAGDDECSVEGCSTDFLQVNLSAGSRETNTSNRSNSTLPPEAAVPAAGTKEMEKRLNVSIGNVSHANTSINASLKSANGWVGCWYYGCRRSYHPEFRCQCNPGCRRYGNCCGDFGTRCWWLGPSPPAEDRRRRRRRRAKPPPPPPSQPNSQWAPSPPQNGIATVYHQTSPQACKAILASSFRPGSDGHCGGAIYFAMSPEATKTKAIGTQSQSGCVIQGLHTSGCRQCGEAKVEIGRVKYEGPKCGHKWEPGELKQQGYDSIQFDPGDGQEVVIFDPNQVKSMKEIPYNSAWKPEYNVR